ncbi:pre-mRNA-processing protein 40C [Macadamia integrifolia]|uniref:pre-mRNA-processing protein 40C n=1 Tax=Macadamia integrifolia TaxID=60698 RepID=UPI001C52F043|nr:pre-mRNA-processing protein 40C [Macadamia integrifolia]
MLLRLDVLDSQMSSPAWIMQEVQSAASAVVAEASVSGPLVAGPNIGPPTPTAAPPAPVVGPLTPKVPYSTASDSVQEPVRPKFVNAPGYVVPAPSFTYNVIPKANSLSGSSQHLSSSNALKSNPVESAATLQPPVPGQSSSGPTLSYNLSPAIVGTPSGQQFQSGNVSISGRSEGAKTSATPAASQQPIVPGQPGQLTPLASVTTAQIMPPLIPSPVSVPKGASSIAAGFSFGGISQLAQKDPSSNSNASATVVKGAGTTSATSSSSQSVPLSVNTSSSSMSLPVARNSYPATMWMSTAPSFPSSVGILGTPGTPGPPGIVPSASMSTVSVRFAATDSSSSVVPRPLITSTTAAPSNPTMQQPIYPPYSPLPPMAPSSQGSWLTPQIGGLQRPPFLQYPGVLPGPFPMPIRGMPGPSVPIPESQASGVSPIGPPGGTPTLSVGSGNQLVNNTVKQSELSPPGIDQGKHARDGGAANNEELDAWTAHKTETGAVYYYNAFTGESTYEKPPGYKGEPEKVTEQPTPVSWEKLAGTDWTLVTTNDGKKYYYSTKTKVSSWQIPAEVAAMRKKQDGDSLKENTSLAQNTGVSSDKVSAPISLNAPAISTGGRDATALRPSGAAGSSSALDLIKKKLQDSTTPVTSSPLPTSSGPAMMDLNGSRAVEVTVKGPQSESSKDKQKDANGDGNLSDSSSDSEDVDSGPTKEECIIQFKEMLKERGVAPFSKWEKELPKIVFDPRFKAVPGYSTRRAVFEHYVRTRAEEERKEKRAAQKAAIEGFKQLLEEVSEDIDHKTDYQTFKKKWGKDPRFESLDRKERENLLNERVLPLKKAAEDKIQAIRVAAASSFKSMLQERGDINARSRWSRVKDSLRNDPRYKSVKHEEREILFNEYISELKAAEEEAEQAAKVKREEQDKLKERERETRKRKEREEQEMERVRLKVRRKEAVASYQALLVETIKDPQASWTESKPKLEKDPQGRASNTDLDQGDTEKLFREHVKVLYERCAREFRTLLAEVITAEAASQLTEDGKTILTSWSTAKCLLKADSRYSKMPRKDRETLWRRHVEEMTRKQKLASDSKQERQNKDTKDRSSLDSGRSPSVSRRTHGQR